MFLFGVFCLIAFATALPAPQSSELTAPDGNDLHTIEILSPIPEAPMLEPLVLIEHITKPKSKGTDSKEETRDGYETEIDGMELIDKVPEVEEVLVTVEQPSGLPSSWDGIITFLFNPSSWPSFSNILPSWLNFNNILS